MSKFKKGDEVRLRYGGPRMVVEEILPGDRIRCSYIHNLIEQRTGIFETRQLESAERLKYCPHSLLE